MEQGLRVLVCDDDPRLRSAVTDLLGLDARVLVVGQTDTGYRIAELAREVRAELVLVDVRMPYGGSTAVTALRRGHVPGRGPVVVVMSAQTDSTTVAAMFAAGAVAYLPKGTVGEVLGDLLLRAAAGERLLGVPRAARAVRDVLGELTLALV